MKAKVYVSNKTKKQGKMEKYKITSHTKANGIKTHTLEKSDTDIESGKFRPLMQSTNYEQIQHCLDTILIYKKK